MGDKLAADPARAADPALVVSGLTVWLGHGQARHEILRDVSLSIARGETVGLIGESGSGKTTLARAILRLIEASAGTIAIAGTDVLGLKRSALRRFRRSGTVQYVFQNPLLSLDPDLTAAASVGEPLRIRGEFSKEVRSRLADAFASVNLGEELLDRRPGELSGGQRQRVAIARALVSDPELVILDEPVSALDAATRVQVLKVLKSLKARRMSSLFISHDLGSVAGIADRVAVLYQGEIVEEGPVADIVNRPQHPFTQLLIASAPTLSSVPLSRVARDELRERIDLVTLGRSAV